MQRQVIVVDEHQGCLQGNSAPGAAAGAALAVAAPTGTASTSSTATPLGDLTQLGDAALPVRRSVRTSPGLAAVKHELRKVLENAGVSADQARCV